MQKILHKITSICFTVLWLCHTIFAQRVVSSDSLPSYFSGAVYGKTQNKTYFWENFIVLLFLFH